MRIEELYESVAPRPEKIVSILRTRMKEPTVIDDPNAPKDFLKMANTQRHGGAELVMIRLKRDTFNDFKGGLGSPMSSYKHHIEHIGDLTHRLGEFMSMVRENTPDVEIVQRAISGVNFASEKIEKAAADQFFNSWPKNQKALLVLYPDLRKTMKEYTKAHRRVPVFNKVQFHAREAAVSLGRVDLGECHHHIHVLNTMIKNGTAYIEACLYEKGKYR